MVPIFNPISNRWLAPGFPCTRCQELATRREEEERQRTRVRGIQDKLESFLLKAGIPKRFLSCELSNYRTTLTTQYILDQSFRFLRNENLQGIYLFGPTGVGKTHLATSLTREFILQGKEVSFRNVLKFFLEIRQSFNPKSNHLESEKELLDRYLMAPILVLDDLGAERITPWSKAIFSMVLNDRYEEIKKRLILTSNLNLKQIEQAYSPRVASRIAGMCVLLNVVGPDHRLRRS